MDAKSMLKFSLIAVGAALLVGVPIYIYKRNKAKELAESEVETPTPTPTPTVTPTVTVTPTPTPITTSELIDSKYKTSDSIIEAAKKLGVKNSEASTSWSGIEHNNYLMNMTNIINRMAFEKVYTSGETLFNDASKEFLAKRKADNSI